METVFTLKNLLFVGALIVSANSPAAFAATQKETCANKSDWYAAITCYDDSINTLDKTLTVKYQTLFSGDAAVQKIINFDRDNWLTNHKASCGVAKPTAMTDSQIFCLSSRYKANQQVLSTYFGIMAGYSHKPVPMASIAPRLDQQVVHSLRQNGLAPVAVLTPNAIPVYYVLDADIQKLGMYFYDTQSKQLQKIQPSIGEVVNFALSGEDFLMLLKGYTKTYEITDEAYLAVKLRRNGTTFSKTMQRLIASRYYKTNDVCAKSKPAAAAIETATLVKDFRIITAARDDKTTIEFTLDEVDCKTNLAKTVVISRDI